MGMKQVLAMSGCIHLQRHASINRNIIFGKEFSTTQTIAFPHCFGKITHEAHWI
jgi:hypothetical protein